MSCSHQGRLKMILSDLMTSNVLTLLAYEPNAFRFYASSSFLSARLISCEENVPPTHPPPKLLKTQLFSPCSSSFWCIHSNCTIKLGSNLKSSLRQNAIWCSVYYCAAHVLLHSELCLAQKRPGVLQFWPLNPLKLPAAFAMLFLSSLTIAVWFQLWQAACIVLVSTLGQCQQYVVTNCPPSV